MGEHETILPDGEYEGLFTGHTMRFAVQHTPDSPLTHVAVETDLGVRGINIPHIFCVVDGKIDESTINLKGGE